MGSNSRVDNYDFERTLRQISQEDSDLGVWLGYCPSLFKQIVLEVAAVREFYRENRDYADSAVCFEERLSRFLASGDADKGFIGELEVAYRLAQRKIPHRFIKTNNQTNSPDIELTIVGTSICFEVKMNEVDFWDLLCKRLWEELHIGITAIRDAKPNQGHRYALIRIAIQLASDRLAKGYGGPIQYNGIEGQLNLTFPQPRHGQASYCTGGWPSARRKNGIPWFEATLRDTLKSNIAQFRTGRPTFLVYVNHDLMTSDIETLVSQILKDGQTEFLDVAGIIVLDPFIRWYLRENHALRYNELKNAGLFDAMAKLGEH